MNTITIFTDGSSRGNPGPGGWAALIIHDNQVTELGGREDRTTNNRMEMTAAIRALETIDTSMIQTSRVIIYTDSSYLINGITKWVHGWQKNNWITSQKKDVENKDLWELLIQHSRGVHISWTYVSGHVGILGNERCDEIATAYADSVRIELYKGPFSTYPIKNVLDVSHNETISQRKESSSMRSKMKAFSYISAIGGDVKIHKTWADCEQRVKGVRGARFKKALSKEEEEHIVRDFRKIL